jgi:hypothetical protein
MWDAYGYNAEDYDAGTGMSYLIELLKEVRR